MAADDIDAAALLAAYDAACMPNEARRDRVLARLLRPGARAVFLDDRRRADTAELARAVLLAVAAAVLAVLGLELATGARTMGRVEHQHYEAIDDAAPADERATAVEGNARGVVVPQPAELPPSQPIATIEPVAPLAEKPARVEAPRMRPRAAGVAEEAIAPADHERALIDDARAAIARHGWREAVAALRRHAREFPEGRFGDEREALEIVVDCQLDPAEVRRARRRGTAFVVRHPGSALAQEVIAACRSHEPAPGEVPKVVDPFADSP